MPKLQLGTGDSPKKGYVNHDRVKHSPHVDVTWDLDELPWPWPNELFSEVLSWAVFEHLWLRLDESIGECWRILKPGGLLVLKVPHVGATTVVHDPTHIWRGWTEETFDFFDPGKGMYGERGAMYGIYPWELLSVELFVDGNAIAVRMKKRPHGGYDG